MSIQSVTVNGHTYTLLPTNGYFDYTDYYVETTLNGVSLPCGALRWAGNGSTTFDYQVYDVLEETLGVYATRELAVEALDARLFPV